MQATLVRFGPDLHAELKQEASRAGISVAQFVREAVVARIAYSAGRRGDPAFREAIAAARQTRARAAQTQREVDATRGRVASTRDEADAVQAQAEQAVRRRTRGAKA
jgi:hypothetical protein